MSTSIPSSRRLLRALAPLALLLAAFSDAPTLAQTRAALTRDVDNPALQPFRSGIFISVGDNQGYKAVNGPTVPAGKRLVLENVSVWAFGATSDFDVTGVWLSVPGAATPTYVLLDPNVTERRLIAGGTTALYAYNRVVKLYYEPGETVLAEVFIEGAAGINISKLVNIYLNGYFVTL
jgi:hypothetical protein